MDWFTADLHLDHEQIVDFSPRGFDFTCVREWNAACIDALRHYVHKHDRLFILGDFAWHKRFAYWKTQIPGDVWLIRGNHDPSPAKCRAVFGRSYRDVYETKVGGVPCWLSHYPHAFWPKSHKGSFHLYGHCHTHNVKSGSTT